jgi:capsular exopolysaccharide synthesis family protein
LEDEINLGQYFSVLLRWYRLIILAALLAGFAALVVSFMTPPTYEAEAAVAIIKSGTQINFDPKIKTISEMDTAQLASDQTARRKSLTTIASSPDIATAVIAKMGDQLEESERIPVNLAGAIKATTDGDLIKIKASANNAEKAAILANTWTQEYLDRVNALYGESALAPTEIQAQADTAKRDYDQKEAALVAYLANNPIDQLSRQIAQKQQKLADLRTLENKIDRLLSDATALRNRLSSGGPNIGVGDDLAKILLEASAFSTWANLPVSLQIPIDKFSTGTTPAEQLRTLDTLIAALESRRKTIQEGTYVQLEQEANQLQAQLEQENAKKQELTRARDLAWSTYTTLSNKVAEVGIAAQSKGSVVRLAVPAIAPRSPVAPKKSVNTLLGGVVGLMLGVGAAFLFEYLKNTVSSAEQAETLLKLPALGAIPDAKGNSIFAVVREPRSAAAESFRLLQHTLSANNAWKTLLITSTLPSEGKSTVASNLAAAIAQSGKRVAVVDANFRHPTQHEIFGLKNQVGLATWLFGNLAKGSEPSQGFEAMYQPTEIAGLSVLTSGPPPADPAQLLASDQLTRLIDRLEANVDVVVIDAPATLGLVDASIAARVADALLMVVENGKVSPQDALRAKEVLAATGIPIAGVVLNRARELPGALTYEQYAHLEQPAHSPKSWWTRGRDWLVALLGPR